jgi:LysM repeat protein
MSKLYFLTVLSALFFLLPFTPVNAQVPVEISSQKIIVEGKVYYMHTVKKGQTVYSISRAYGITEDVLKKENPLSSGGIKEGQVLKVPSAQTQSQSQMPQQQAQTQTTPQTASATKGLIYHTVEKDETAYSLSKKYNVTVEDIVRSNPGLNINSIPVGTRLTIPDVMASAQKEVTPAVQKEVTRNQTSFQTSQKETQPADDGKNIYHRVTKDETLSSISRDYNISLRDLKKANK